MANLNVDAATIIGSIMPNIFIDQVKLESTGGFVPARDNPHITDDMESVRTDNTRQLKVSVQSSLKDSLSKSFLNSWFMKNKFVNYLSYVVMCSTNKEVTDLLLELDSLRSGTIRGFTPGSYFLGGGSGRGALPQEWINSWEDNIKHRLKTQGFAQGNLRLQTLIDNNLKAVIDQVSPVIDAYADHARVHDAAPAKPYIQTDDRGREIYNFSLSTQFDPMTEVRPKHLTIFAYTLFEIDKYFADLSEGGQLLIDQADSDMGFSRLTVHSVIDNFQTVRDSIVFRHRETDEIYVGPYHTMSDGGLMTGATHTDGGSPLYVETVPNMSVQDFRNFEELNPNVIDLSAFQKDLLPSTNRFFSEYVRDNLENRDKTNYYSDIWMTRGIGGECNFAITVDLGKIVKENSKYSWLLEEQPSLIQAYFRILSFKILRRRVKKIKRSPQQKYAGGATTDNPDSKHAVLFDDGYYSKSIGANFGHLMYDAPEVIVETTQDSNSADLALRRKGRRGTRQASIRELNLIFTGTGDADDVRTYSISDGGVADLGAGEYQYGIELEIQDNLIDYLNSHLIDLLNVRSELAGYYARANAPTGTSRSGATSYRDPHLAPSREEGTFREVNYDSEKAFDVRANRFTQSFIDAEFDPEADWRSAPFVVMRILELFEPIGGFLKPLADYANELLAMCAPETGSPDGIQSVLKLMDDLAFNLARIIDTKISTKGTAAGSVPSTMDASSGLSSGTPPKKTFKVLHYFENDVFDASFPKDTGYDYLLRESESVENTQQNTSRRYGLRTIRDANFRARLGEEVGKYIDGNDLPTDAISNPGLRRTLGITPEDRYKYLSPSRGMVQRGRGIEMNFLTYGIPASDNFPHDKFAAFIAQLANFKSPTGQPFVEIAGGGTGLDSIRDNLVEVLADKSCTIEAPHRRRTGREVASERHAAERRGIPFDAHLPETFNLDVEEDSDDRNLMDIIGIHTTMDTDVFNPSKVFMRLLINLILEDGDLVRRETSLRGEGSLFTIDTFDLSNSDESEMVLMPGPELPFQIKSLFLSSVDTPGLKFSLPAGDALQDPEKAAVFFLNFFRLVKLEALQRFGNVNTPVSKSEVGAGALNLSPNDIRNRSTTRPQRSLKKPEWVPLTSEILSNATRADRETLVRMTLHSDARVGIKALAGLNLDIFDTYFVITNTDPVRRNKQPRQRTAIPPQRKSTVPREYTSTDPRDKGLASRSLSRSQKIVASRRAAKQIEKTSPPVRQRIDTKQTIRKAKTQRGRKRGMDRGGGKGSGGGGKSY